MSLLNKMKTGSGVECVAQNRQLSTKSRTSPGDADVLACDMRFASRQSALFGNPEVGVGLVPGGGAMEWLPRLIGRSRALEFVLSADDFDGDIAERYGWVNRTVDDGDLDSFVDALVRRLASFE